MDITLITENFIETIEEFGKLTEPQRMAIRGALISNLHIVEMIGINGFCANLKEKQTK